MSPSYMDHMDLNLGRSCSQIGPLGPRCAILEASWAEIGAKSAQVGPKLGPCWTPSRADMGRCCGHVGPKRSIWTILGPSAKGANCIKLLQSHALFCNLFKSELKLCQSDRSVQSYPSLPNYHASAPSVRADLILVALQPSCSTSLHSAIQIFLSC